ncbi:conserved hypothetical protein [Trichormus variabilis ATCC 29413]|uniref:Uncharacterized protein n=2 Tax=Anabaena variabilis TaxID=264691 RepID=Q3MCD7_TRIV2|nr:MULTISPECIES: hypothetical protein [Nostocaceae]ABA21349.1 conserved hypothetical protein [Trichormus variabilis ATCC 29413]MBC1213650.1 hypothetical protein [Trichormus variabilis ARAD]MBC1254001.1 hypothetical protein [Trichormus variabilis V5]MBC1267756.1 hypothetical protein [Trichormus variabilis FSR]MBC1302108.1 hypothetical protein [Trichormus variabilis N2B]
MLKSYEAIYENGQIKWVSEQLQVNTARVIVTFIEEILPSKKRRTVPESIGGKGKTLGDIV